MAASASQPVTLIADWRHLGVIPRAGRALVIGGEYPDLRPVFEVTEVQLESQIPESAVSYQLIVICCRLLSPDTIVAIERALDPDGGVAVFVVPPGPSGSRRYRPLAIRARSLSELVRGSRLQPHSLLGALPDPWAPEYVFPLTTAAGGLAIEQFLLSRRPGWGRIGRVLRIGPLARLAMWALPGGLLLCRIRGDRP